MIPSDALSELRAMLGEGLSTGKSDLDLHGRSETWPRPMPPDAVAYPGDTTEVAAIVGTCALHGVPVIGWGTGTALEGHAQAPRGGLTVDVRNMGTGHACGKEARLEVRGVHFTHPSSAR